MLRPECIRCAGVAGWVSVAGNVCLAVVKWFVGLSCGSQALVADAMHSSVDVVGSCITLLMLKLSKRRATEGYPYGFGKLEDVAALAIYLILVGAGTAIVVDAVGTIVNGHLTAPRLPALGAALLSVGINAFMYYFISCAGRNVCSPSLIALGYENKVDALSSVAAMVGIMGAVAGLPVFDPLAAIVVSGVIITESLRELLEATQRLTDKGLEPSVRNALRTCVLGTRYVQGVLNCRTRRLGAVAHADIDILVDADMSVDAAGAVSQAVCDRVRLHVDGIDSVRVFTFPASESASPRSTRVSELVEVIGQLGLQKHKSGGRS